MLTALCVFSPPFSPSVVNTQVPVLTRLLKTSTSALLTSCFSHAAGRGRGMPEPPGENTENWGLQIANPLKQCASNFSWMWDFSSILLALRRLTRVLGAQGLCLWGTECHHIQVAPCLAGGPVFDEFSRPRVPSLCRLLYQLNNACAVMSHTHRRHSTHWDWKDGSSLNKRSFLCNTTATKAFGMNSNSGKCI